MNAALKERQQRREIMDKVSIVATLNLKKYRDQHNSGIDPKDLEKQLRGSLYKTATVIKNNFLSACRNGKNNGYSYETCTALIASQRKQSRAAIREQVKKLLEIGYLTNKRQKGHGRFPTNYFLTINPEALGNVFAIPENIQAIDNPACFDKEERRIRAEVNRAAFTAATLLARHADEVNAEIPYEDRAERLRGSLADTAQTILTLLFTAAKEGENNGYSFETNTATIAREKGQSRKTIIRHIKKLTEMKVLDKSTEGRRSKKHYIVTFNKEIIRDVLSDVDFTRQIAEESQKAKEGEEVEAPLHNGTLERTYKKPPANDGFDDSAEGWKTYLSELFGSLESPPKSFENPPDTS